MKHHIPVIVILILLSTPFIGLSNQVKEIDNKELDIGEIIVPNNFLLAYWKFDEGSGNILYDYSGHGYHGTIYGATWAGTSGLIFDGIDDYVDFDNHSENLGFNKTDYYLISAPIKSTSSSGTIYSMGHTELGEVYFDFKINENGTFSVHMGDETNFIELYTDGSYNDGNWHMVDVRYYGDTTNPTIDIYVDNELDSSVTKYLPSFSNDDFKKVKMGRKSNEEIDYLDGILYEIKIFKNIPPVTTHSLDPKTPDGDNEWYVSNVTVTLDATDEISGINSTYYRINDGNWTTYTDPFVIYFDGEHILDYYSIDNDGCEEEIKSVEVKMDQTIPEMEKIEWEAYQEEGLWFIILTCYSEDATSEMNHAEFYANGELQETITGLGPEYQFIVEIDIDYHIAGLICNSEFNKENMSFFAIAVRTYNIHSLFSSSDHISIYVYDNAGNYNYDDMHYIREIPSYHYFKHFYLKNNYKGYVGRFFIFATFEDKPIEIC